MRFQVFDVPSNEKVEIVTLPIGTTSADILRVLGLSRDGTYRVVVTRAGRRWEILCGDEAMFRLERI